MLIKTGCYSNLSAGAGTWLDENLKGQWHFFGREGVFYIYFEYEEDKCMFILKYGEFLE